MYTHTLSLSLSQVSNSRFRALIEALTPTTYVMVVSSAATALPTTISVNISNVREFFERQLRMWDEAS
jgi:hypothetical protein